METFEIQQQLFNHLKTLLPAHISIVDELCDLLGLSADSVYRRIRGEKPIALSELKVICEKYHISLDHVLQLQNDSVVFQAPEINRRGMSFAEYLQGVVMQLKYMNSFEKRQMYYLCKDIPLWYFYIFPELAAFKTFVWVKTIQNSPGYAQKKFSLKDFPFDDCFKLGQEMLNQYNQMASIELWNLESIVSTIRQIEYYRDAGIFSNIKDLDLVIDSFAQTMDHVEAQVETGYKFSPGATDLSYRSTVKFYVNEVILGNNTILVDLNGNRQSFVSYNVHNYLLTKDPRFNDVVFSNFFTLMSRSSLISESGEKERIRFFRNIRERIQGLKK